MTRKLSAEAHGCGLDTNLYSADELFAKQYQQMYVFKPCVGLIIIVLITSTCNWRFGAVGSDVGQINEVTLRRARLVLGWVTVQLLVREIYLSLTNHPGQLSLAIHQWVGAMSTGQRAVMLCDWGVKADIVLFAGNTE